jgi:hypothetical protein
VYEFGLGVFTNPRLSPTDGASPSVERVEQIVVLLDAFRPAEPNAAGLAAAKEIPWIC